MTRNDLWQSSGIYQTPIFVFNDKLFEYVLIPVSKGYTAVVLNLMVKIRPLENRDKYLGQIDVRWQIFYIEFSFYLYAGLTMSVCFASLLFIGTTANINLSFVNTFNTLDPVSDRPRRPEICILK